MIDVRFYIDGVVDKDGDSDVWRCKLPAIPRVGDTVMTDRWFLYFPWDVETFLYLDQCEVTSCLWTFDDKDFEFEGVAVFMKAIGGDTEVLRRLREMEHELS